ncbi:MAG: hypothetical protein CMJ76_01645 [Planctomycetaceae bacterium]|nr:hypothetical protein [Planctomycetaceae bacterium]
MPWNTEQAARRQHEESAARIVAIWTHDVLSTPNHGAVQGFGGRMYFYNRKQQAVEVEGQLVVYAFDDTDQPVANHSQRQPNRKYVFRAEQLQTHISESELGPSYSFWLPWQKFGGDERKISLVPVFIPNKGNVINGLFSKVTLPGNNRNQNDTHSKDQLVHHNQPDAMRVDTFDNRNTYKNLTQTGRRNTQTINLSPNLTRHMTNAPQQVVSNINHQIGSTERPQTPTVALPNYDDYNARRRPTGIQTSVNRSGLKTIKIGPPQRP